MKTKRTKRQFNRSLNYESNSRRPTITAAVANYMMAIELNMKRLYKNQETIANKLLKIEAHGQE